MALFVTVTATLQPCLARRCGFDIAKAKNKKSLAPLIRLHYIKLVNLNFLGFAVFAGYQVLEKPKTRGVRFLGNIPGS
jgi:hypothetical protein